MILRQKDETSVRRPAVGDGRIIEGVCLLSRGCGSSHGCLCAEGCTGASGHFIWRVIGEVPAWAGRRGESEGSMRGMMERAEGSSSVQREPHGVWAGEAAGPRG